MNYFIEDAKICVSGTYLSGHAIGVFPQNLERAKHNVEHILSQSEKKQFILIGAEHLFFLNTSHRDKGIACIIEPSADYLDFVRTNLSDSSQIQNWRIVSGYWGNFSPLMDPKIGSAFLTQELGKIALEIFSIKDDANLETILLTCKPPNDTLSPLLAEVIGTTQTCKKWHHAQAEAYTAIRKQAKNQLVYFIHHHKHALTDADLTAIRALIPHQEVRPLALGPDPAATLAILQQAPPAFIAVLNRSAFRDSSDVLFYETMFHNAGIPIHFYYTDNFSHQCDLINGGWSYYLWQDHKSQESNDQVFTIYKEHAPFVLPKNQNCQFIAYPYRNLLRETNTEASGEPCPTDVAIVNYCRLFAISDEISVEFFELITAALGPESAAHAWVILDHMRDLIRTREPFARKPHLGQVIINRFDYLFYNQIRIRNVLQFVKTNQGLKIDIYGNDWKKVLPTEVCRGPINSTEHLAQIYRSATVTVDFTKSLMQEQPHFTAIECLFAGGFPVCYALPAAHKPAGSWLSSWPLPTFECLEEIPAIVQNHRDPVLRQQLISEARQAFDAWHTRFNNPAQLSVRRLSSIINQDILNYLANAGIGYILYELGFMADAAKAWRALPKASGPAADLLMQRLQIAVQKSQNPVST